MKTLPAQLMTAFALATLSISESSGALLSTISASGYNSDIVFETGLTSGQQGISTRFGDRAFFQNGALGASIGLPANVTKTVLSGNNVDFNFQPFTANNALILSGANSNTVARSLDFSSPAGYSNIGIVVSGGALNSAAVGSTSTNLGTISYVINYQGGGVQTGNLVLGDWGNPYVAGTAETFYTAERTNEASNNWPVTSSIDTRWKLFFAEIVPNSSAAITSIDFTGSRAASTTDATITGLQGTGYNSQLAIFGLVGTTIPEPSPALLGAATAVLALSRRRRPQ